MKINTEVLDGFPLNMNTPQRRYWVVSPNVRDNNGTVQAWRHATIASSAAFMGYAPDDYRHKRIGYKFAHVIRPNDIIMIARRFQNQPEIVGYGIVEGKFRTRLKGFRAPEQFGALRKLSPFKPLTSAPPKLPFMHALTQTTALRELHPQTNSSHRAICNWMERMLGRSKLPVRTRRSGKNVPTSARSSAQLSNLPREHELEYEVRSRRRVLQARKVEARLVRQYRDWVESQQRKLYTVLYRRLRCDAYDPERKNLIEAKSSTKREYLRMAVGQLFDYLHLGRSVVGDAKLAVLLPAEPDREAIGWLSELKISVVWRKRGKFFDNANGQFT